MNPALIIIVIFILVALWFMLSFAFFPIGKILKRIWDDAVDEINMEDKKEEKENER